MRTVFLGTSEFAAAILTSLHNSAHRPALVVTRPDRPSGRGRKLTSPPVALRTRELGIDLTQPESVNSDQAREQIASVKPETVIVCAFGALIKEPLLSEFPMLNVHPSLLARWRGAAPIERAIMAGDEHTGVSIMRLTAGLDDGPICLRGVERIDPMDTYGSLSERLMELGAKLLIRALEERPEFEEQDESTLTYAEKITAADRLLDPSKPAVALERVVRALHPHIGARAELADSSFIGVLEATIYTGPAPRAWEPGIRAHEGRLLLVCEQGVLELLQVKPPGGRPMEARAFLRGHGQMGRL